MTESPADDLLNQVLHGGTQARLSVVGLSKNAGKTVTLNHLIGAAAARKLTLGLVSTGRDGEEQDAITELPKPRIWAPSGTWLATARNALTACTAKLTTFRDLPLMTPFGPVVLARVEQAGEVLLIGPGSVRRVGEVLGALEGYGARLSLVDGSFDRIAAAAPGVTGRVVLAAGAAYSASLAETIAQIRHVLDIFDLPPVPPDLETPIERAAARHAVSVVTAGGGITPVLVASPLGDPEIIAAAAAERDEYLVLDGAFSDRLLLTLLKRRLLDVTVVVNDPTHVLVDRSLWRRWRRQGGRVQVRRSIQVLAITPNPHSPVGRSYDPPEFLQAVQQVAHRPVYDLEAGLSGR